MTEETRPEAGSESMSMHELGALLSDMPAENEPEEANAPEGKPQSSPESKEPEAPEQVAEEEEEGEPSEDAEGDDADEDEADDTEEPEDSDDDPLVDVLTDGKQQKIKLSELVKGYHKSHNYEKKSQKLSENRREVDTELQAVRQRNQELIETLEQVKPLIQSQFAKFANVDWDDLAENDPTEYTRLRHQYDKTVLAAQQGQAKQQELLKWQKEDFDRRMEAYKSEQDELLAKEIPDYADPVKKGEAKARLNKYLENQGFTKDDIETLVDARLRKTLEKARRWDAAQARKGEALSKLKPQAKFSKPRGSQEPREANAKRLSAHKQRLKETGDVRDLAAVFSALE